MAKILLQMMNLKNYRYHTLEQTLFYINLFFLLLFLQSCSSHETGIDSIQIRTNKDKNISLKPIEILNENDEITAHQHILRTYGGEYKNKKLEKTLAEIVGNLLNTQKNSDQNYRITLLNSSNINAFALPNGYVYITRGLLALANDSSEIAGVIAHEMAHIIAHHGILRLEKMREIQNLYFKKKSSLNSQQDPFLSNELYLAQFSQKQELEADAIAIQILVDTGYDPFSISRFLERMEKYNHFKNKFSHKTQNLDFLTTHPATPQRIALANQKAQSLIELSPPNSLKHEKRKLLLNLNGLLYNAAISSGFIRDNEFISLKKRIAFKVPPEFSLTLSQSNVSASDGEQTALRFDIIPQFKQENLFNFIKSNWIRGLDLSSIRNIQINNFSGAYATASNNNWYFSVILLFKNNQLYRFLSASKKPLVSDKIAFFAAQNFRFLSQKDTKQIKPLYVRTLCTKEGDNVETLSQKMKGTQEKVKFFRLLNDLQPDEEILPHSLVKIIDY